MKSENSESPADKVSRVRALDAARGIAALIVAVYHCLLALPVSDPFGFPHTPAYHALWRKILLPGDLAVTLFFVISGASFGVACVDLSKFRAKAFFIRRFFRIYPLYLFSILTGFLISLIYLKFASAEALDAKDWLHAQYLQKPDPGVWFFYLTMSFNWFLHKAYFNNALWTLPIEAQFYLFVPLFVFLLSKAGSKIGSAAIVFLCMILYVYTKIVHLYAAPLEWLWQFAGGFLLGHFLIRENSLPSWIDKIPRMAVLPLFYLSRLYLPIRGLPLNFFSVLTAFCLVYICLRNKNWGHEKAHEFWIHLGDRSYSLYLLHMPVIFVFAAILETVFPPLPPAAFFISLTLLVVPLTYRICGVVYRFELAFINMGRHLAASHAKR